MSLEWRDEAVTVQMRRLYVVCDWCKRAVPLVDQMATRAWDQFRDKNELRHCCPKCAEEGT